MVDREGAGCGVTRFQVLIRIFQLGQEALALDLPGTDGGQTKVQNTTLFFDLATARRCIIVVILWAKYALSQIFYFLQAECQTYPAKEVLNADLYPLSYYLLG